MKNLDNVKRNIDFNKNWRFCLNSSLDASKINFDDTLWQKLNLPHDWSIYEDFSNEVSSEIGHLKGGIGWYRKSFVLDKNLQGKRIYIDFDGIYMDSYIYVNGKLVGNYPNGYIPFSFDITDYVFFDNEKENLICIKVSNITNKGEQSSRWYSGSGIYRDVHLSILEPIHIAKYETYISTPNIKNEIKNKNISINFKTVIKNYTEHKEKITLKNTILEYKSKEILKEYELNEIENILPNNELKICFDMSFENPKLWDIENPNLYIMKTEIFKEGKILDTYETRFGFNWTSFDKDNGFSLNGKYTKLYGVCMHHDQGALGAVANFSAIKRQMEIMKKMGVNAIRVTHNPASPHLIKICDEMGLMVIEEAFDTWFDGKNKNDYGRFFEARCTYPNVSPETTWAKFDLQQMIKININSPCIIMWSLGNEIGETGCQKGFETVKNLIKWAKEIDSIRPVTMGEDKFRIYPNATMEDWFVKTANELDVVGMNYAEDNYDYFKTIYKNKPIYGSETSSAVNSRGYYSDPYYIGKDAQIPKEYQLSSYDNRAVPWGKTATDSWIPDRDRKWICGQFIWTGFDYIGEPTPWNQSFIDAPKSSYFGIVDTAGFPKDDYFLYQSQWLDFSKNPMVHIFPHWNWEDKEMREKVIKDGKIPVRVYSNAPKVELFLDNVSQGEKQFFKKTTKDGRIFNQQSEDSDRLYLEWELDWKYKEGTTIKAVAKDDEGNILKEDTIITSGKATKLKVFSEKMVIDADGYDLAYINVFAEDYFGNFVPNAMNCLNFSISGDGEIVGVDNGDSASWERYKEKNGVWKRSLFNGKAIVIVKSTEKQGKFTLKIDGAGVLQNEITIFTKDRNTKENVILGYQIPNISTKIFEMPILPEKINAIYSNGEIKKLSVKWEDIKEEFIKNAKNFTLNGQLENNEKIFVDIKVFDIAGVLPIIISKKLGEDIILPKKANVIYTNGEIKQKDILKWDDIKQEKLQNIGKVEIFGDLGISYKVKLILNIFEDEVAKENKALLEEIKIGNDTIKDFDTDKTEYFSLIDYNSNLPTIFAKANEYGELFILNANDNSNKAIIKLFSEDGKYDKDYTVFFIRKAPSLKNANIKINKDIKEDDILDINVDVVLENDEPISEEFLNINYIIENNTGEAIIKNSQLLAYKEGEVYLYANIKYKDSILTTEKICLKICKNNINKNIIGFKDVEISTFAEQKPILPKTVLAYYDNGLPREVNVKWEDIDDKLYNNLNIFEIYGNVQNSNIKPKLVIKVLEGICAENYSTAIPKGYKEELPENTTVYLTDLTEEKCSIKWEEDFELKEDTKIYKGIVSYLKNQLPIKASFRISDYTQSPNYVIQRNGYDLPVGLAYDTNTEEGFSAKKLNDGLGSSNIKEKLIWSSPKDLKESWISVTIASEGLNIEKTVDKIRFGLIYEKDIIELPEQYFIEYYTGDLDYSLNLVKNENEKIKDLGKNHKLNDDKNWKEVSYINKPIIEKTEDFRRTIEVDFIPIKTHLIRIRMISKAGFSVGSDEIQVYGKIPNIYNYFDVNAIYINGVNHISSFSNNKLNLKLKEGEDMPNISVDVSNNASVTIIKNIQKSEIIIKIIPENRAETGIKYYKINLI